MKCFSSSLKSLFCAVIAISLASSVTNAALFDGQTVRIEYLFPDIFTTNTGPTNVVVGPGAEAVNFVAGISLDISDTQLRFFDIDGSSNTAASFNGWHLFDVNGTIPDFTSVTIDPATTMLGVTPGRITFDANNIYVNMESLDYGLQPPFKELILNVNSAVPSPAASFLGLTGFGLLALRRGRRS